MHFLVSMAVFIIGTSLSNVREPPTNKGVMSCAKYGHSIGMSIIISSAYINTSFKLRTTQIMQEKKSSHKQKPVYMSFLVGYLYNELMNLMCLVGAIHFSKFPKLYVK